MMDVEFWTMMENAIPVIMGLILAFVAYMSKKAADQAKEAKENTVQIKEQVEENTALTQTIKHDVEVVKATTSSVPPEFSPPSRP